MANEQNLRPGGKSLTGGTTHTPNLTVRVPPDLREQLDAEAAARRCGVSKVVRSILEDWAARRRESQG